MKFNSLNKDIKIYGDLSYRNKNCPSETIEQITFFNYVRTKYPSTIGVIATHQRNEGKRSYGQARMQKAEGMTKGAADIVIPGGQSFVCEMKRKDHTLSRWQDGQIKYLSAASGLGSFTCVALGHGAAIEALEDWINKNKLITL